MHYKERSHMTRKIPNAQQLRPETAKKKKKKNHLKKYIQGASIVPEIEARRALLGPVPSTLFLCQHPSTPQSCPHLSTEWLPCK